MSFRIALSGLNAATADLSVTANNIANTATNGFKGSRAQFSELFSVSPQGVSSLATGSGVRVSQVAQQFTQGSIDFTDSSLDLAVSGQGFFVLSDGGALAYTRAGAFQVDRDGFVVNSNQQRLQVFPPTPGGGFNTGSLADLQLVTTESPPQATTTADFVYNLPANASQPPVARSIRPIRTRTTTRLRSPSTTRSGPRTRRRCISSRRRCRTNGSRNSTSTARLSEACRRSRIRTPAR
jgi:flagellar hook protein FlgE